VAAGQEVDALRDVLGRAARRRLMSSDVPVGVFLSGGLDSLALTAVLRRAPRLRTFTVRARDPALDESADAQKMARALGVEHQIIDPPTDDPDGWRQVLQRFGEPFGSTSALAVDAVARAAREHVTVAITGDGGDEALGGYPRHVLMRRLGRIPRLPGPSLSGMGRLRRLRRAAELLGLDGSDRCAALYEVFGPWRARLTPHDDGGAAQFLVRKRWGAARADDLAAMLRVDRALELADSHCVKVDVACMGNGLEPRSPWLDREVVALCDALPLSARISGRETKRVLRAMLQRDLPAEAARHALSRPKRGFTTGFETALRSDAVRDLLLGGTLERVPGLQTPAVGEILDEHVRSQGNHVFRLGVLVGLALFAERHDSIT
jgi:asparagine synthase (glutamine-hydrolysing)